MQDPTIQRMTEAIASDPEFMEIAKEMQESMLSGNMNGLNLGGEAGGSGAGGMPPGMPNVDPAKYMSAMQRVMGNPQFLEAAESLGKSLLTQAADPQMASLMELFSNPEHSELLKGKLEDLKSDPELRPILEDIEANGQEAMLKYMGDTDIMSKLGRKFQEAMADPEMQARLGSRAATDANGTPAVSGGAGAGDAAGLAELLKQEGVKPDEKDEEGRTPLHFAAGYGELECMEVLLDAGADIDAVDANNNTALHYAAGYGNVETATLLIKRKADVSIKNSEGKTAGEVAELNEQAELVELLKGDVKPEAV
ncbi:hypothetical protein APUTEX25_003956 [Auxenochlorella protothecoides]|nr:hypothetical protein APUTEX25_003956 [Auxenochlorella protothecoides]|eukprot:RMZ53817.1 hypothetical protein APUTEX25_003956 [Auxenochlorella protothecoides]